MSYERAADNFLGEYGVEQSTMMKKPCLRYKGAFMVMMFDKENALIIKVAPQRVSRLANSRVRVKNAGVLIKMPEPAVRISHGWCQMNSWGHRTFQR